MNRTIVKWKVLDEIEFSDFYRKEPKVFSMVIEASFKNGEKFHLCFTYDQLDEMKMILDQKKVRARKQFEAMKLSKY